MSARPGAKSRAVAAQAVFQVIEQGRSLSQALPTLTRTLDGRDKGMAQALAYGTLRFLPALNVIVSEQLNKPLKGELLPLHSLLLVGAYQLTYMGAAEHAAISATVDAAQLLKRGKQKGLVNAVLRSIQRHWPVLQQRIAAQPQLSHAHPRWLADRISSSYPNQAAQIFAANNRQAPMWLRINEQHTSRDEYLALLAAAGIEAIAHAPLSSAIQLSQAVDVQSLPHFAEGWVSVQDIAAQHAAFLLDAQPNERVLDCCAAPGGKTAHIIERQPTATVVAIDVDEQRLQRVHDTLQRLRLHAQMQAADATTTTWWDGQLFDRILLDAPCSATGVIRRHPDIKWLRRASDITELVALQHQLLRTLWPLLKPGGTLLYATCSILPDENTEQIAQFLASTPDAVQVATKPDGAVEWQWLPGDHDGDGFFYAKLEKRP